MRVGSCQKVEWTTSDGGARSAVCVASRHEVPRSFWETRSSCVGVTALANVLEWTESTGTRFGYCIAMNWVRFLFSFGGVVVGHVFFKLPRFTGRMIFFYFHDLGEGVGV